MTDIVERLRGIVTLITWEAAEEIERLRAAETAYMFATNRAQHYEAKIKRLRAALKDLRERAVEEGIHHFVQRIDATLKDTKP